MCLGKAPQNVFFTSAFSSCPPFSCLSSLYIFSLLYFIFYATITVTRGTAEPWVEANKPMSPLCH